MVVKDIGGKTNKSPLVFPKRRLFAAQKGHLRPKKGITISQFDHPVRILLGPTLYQANVRRARQLLAAYIPEGEMGVFAQNLPKALHKNFTGTMTLLRNPDFQNLLVNYPRKIRTFLIAHHTEDDVTSEWRVRGADGKVYNPDDYLTAFSRFVQENQTQIDAIAILLKRPQEWNTKALSELKAKLQASRQRFTPEYLQKAHEIRYQKALVDIISMIKHAADSQSPLLTATERVERAFTQVPAKYHSHSPRHVLDGLGHARGLPHAIPSLTAIRGLPARADGRRKTSRQLQPHQTSRSPA